MESSLFLLFSIDSRFDSCDSAHGSSYHSAVISIDSLTPETGCWVFRRINRFLLNIEPKRSDGGDFEERNALKC